MTRQMSQIEVEKEDTEYVESGWHIKIQLTQPSVRNLQQIL